MRRFGELRTYHHGEALFETGKVGAGMFVVLSGRVCDHPARRPWPCHARHRARAGTVPRRGRLALRPPAARRRPRRRRRRGAADPAGHLRALLVAEAELGERIMRALILRRVALIESGTGGPVIIGAPVARRLRGCRAFLSRNGQPHQVLDPPTDEDAPISSRAMSTCAADLPLVVCPDGTCCAIRPSGARAHRHDRRRRPAHSTTSRSSARAPPASRPRSTRRRKGCRCCPRRASFGGQAGASARIENYLGFPTGISGQALAGRAFVQAQKFGAESC